MKTPKQRFLERSESARRFDDLTVNPEVVDAVHVALAQYAISLPPIEDPQRSWQNAAKLQGAREFSELLMNLGRRDRVQPKQDPGRLETTDA